MPFESGSAPIPAREPSVPRPAGKRPERDDRTGPVKQPASGLLDLGRHCIRCGRAAGEHPKRCTPLDHARYIHQLMHQWLELSLDLSNSTGPARDKLATARGAVGTRLTEMGLDNDLLISFFRLANQLTKLAEVK